MKKKIDWKILCLSTALIFIIGYKWGVDTAISVALVILAIIINGLVVIEFIGWLHSRSPLEKKFWLLFALAIFINLMAIYFNRIVIVIFGGIAVPVFISIALFLDDWLRGKWIILKDKFRK